MEYWTILTIVLLAIVIIINVRRIKILKERANYRAEKVLETERELGQALTQLHKCKTEIETSNSYFCWFLSEYWHSGANDANRAILILRHGLRFFNIDKKPLKELWND